MTDAVTGPRPAPGKECQLVPHPDHRPIPNLLVQGWVSRPSPLRLNLTFRLSDAVPKIVWHEPTREGRADELWKHSCFEAFVRAGTSEGYIELNLAPAKQWALYDLDDYRTNLRPSTRAGLAEIRFGARNGLSTPQAIMRAMLDLPESFADQDLSVGLSVIIEAADGSKSYWALAHPPGKPDFHHRDGFVLTLPA